MSTARRAYDILRAQVNHHWDRMTSGEYADEWMELEAPAQRPATPPATPKTPEEAAAQAEKEEMDQRKIAAKVLGVKPDADYDTVRKEYERLARRADPTKFTEGSEEHQRASLLRQQIEVAYRLLVADVPVIEKRFKNLEID